MDNIVDRSGSLSGFNECYQQALRLLGQREYARFELSQKLKSKVKCAEVDLDSVLDKLIDDGYQSDARCAEALVRSGLARGYGPLKIRTKMQSRKIAHTLMNEYLNDDTI